MTSFPGSPRVLKGAIVGVDVFNPLASVVVFQYNPETLTRTLRPHGAGAEGDRGEAQRVKAPPQETIKLDVEIDATDQLERADPQATRLGIHPVLASLEMLLYPKSAQVIAGDVLMRMGVVEMIQPESPLTLFVWGPKRIVPVRLTDLTITEQAFDTALNPIRAKVTLGLTVLTYHDLGLLSPGGALFMAHQVIKEVMATLNGVGAVSATGASLGG